MHPQKEKKQVAKDVFVRATCFLFSRTLPLPGASLYVEIRF